MIETAGQACAVAAMIVAAEALGFHGWLRWKAPVRLAGAAALAFLVADAALTWWVWPW